MNNIELLLISIALAMDAFSVSICKGLTMKNKFKRNRLVLAISFSIFQILMPIIGYLLGFKFKNNFINFSHIIAFSLLLLIGINMIKDSYSDDSLNSGLSIKELFGLSIATSIDALAIGVSFSFLNINITKAIIYIGITAFIFSFIGTTIGKLIGKKIEKQAQFVGGIILILIGIKILLEHFI